MNIFLVRYRQTGLSISWQAIRVEKSSTRSNNINIQQENRP